GAVPSARLVPPMTVTEDHQAQPREGFEQRAERQLTKTQLPLIIGRATDQRETRRRAAFAPLDGSGLRSAAEAVRDHTIVNLADYLERFADAAEAKGTK